MRVLLILLCLLPAWAFAQYDGLAVGQTAGTDVHFVQDTWWQQVNVSANTPSIDSGFKALDINLDGTDDLLFIQEVWGIEPDSMRVSIQSLNGSELLAAPGNTVIASLMLGDTLRSGANWVNTAGFSGNRLLLDEIARGTIPSITDIFGDWKYVGVRFQVQGQWMYAWLNYQLHGYSTHWCDVTIKPYGWKGDAALTNLEPVFLADELLLYPNPNSGSFRLKLPAGAVSGYSIQVFDALGRQVFGESVPAGAALDRTMELGELGVGMYSVKVQMGNVVVVKKWVKE